MNQNLSVMIVGKGAREHAISVAYEQSDKVSKVIICIIELILVNNRFNILSVLFNESFLNQKRRSRLYVSVIHSSF